MKKNLKVAVVGGGLAGCEAAHTLSRFDLDVDLFEMRPGRKTPAHQSENLGELVCSNSFGSDQTESAPGLLKEEMVKLGSLILSSGEKARVPAGKAFGVDRELFAKEVTRAIEANPKIHLVREEVKTLPEGYEAIVLATGPLTSESLSGHLAEILGLGSLYFYDSISPIVTAESVNLEKAYFGSRYDPENDDYLNCPMNREEYESFVEAVLQAEKVPVRSFEALKCFESCLPIEVLAERGRDTLAFGPMKPVGLIHPRTGKRPHAVVQLRRENDPTTMYNLVGFQTRMKWGEQKRVFKMIPGLEEAEFVRMGSMHRNTYLEGPRVLKPDLSLKVNPRVFIGGQLTGVEGYTESSASGIWAGLNAASLVLKGSTLPAPPLEAALGALFHYITTAPLHGAFAPMNVNFGLLPPLEAAARGRKGRKERRGQMVLRGRKAFDSWWARVRNEWPPISESSPVLIESEAHTHASKITAEI